MNGLIGAGHSNGLVSETASIAFRSEPCDAIDILRTECRSVITKAFSRNAHSLCVTNIFIGARVPEHRGFVVSEHTKLSSGPEASMYSVDIA